MSRRILHLDLDAFFCAVEELLDPSLTGTAFAVGGRPESRGVVTSCSYLARQRGVRSAMPMARAVRICPELKIVTPEHRLYSQKSKQVMQILHEKADLMEQISIDEAFLDISTLADSSENIALDLQTTIRETLGLPCSIGVAANKLVAKIATNYGKSQAHGNKPPNAITIVPEGDEKIFLDPLPVDALWGVGPKTAEKMNELGIRTIGDLARYPVQELSRIFGKHGEGLSRRALGIDNSPISSFHDPKSVSQETTFTIDISSREELLDTLKRLSDRVGKHLVKAGKRGVTVKIKLRWPDFTTLTRQITLPEPIDQGDVIFKAASGLFEKEWKKGQPVRLIGVGVSGFDKPALQLGLWDHQPDAEKVAPELEAAMDELRKRYGSKVLVKASEINPAMSPRKPPK